MKIMKFQAESGRAIAKGEPIDIKIDVNTKEIWPDDIPKKQRKLNLSVDYSVGVTNTYDKPGGKWRYDKTFKRIEKHAKNLSNAIL